MTDKTKPAPDEGDRNEAPDAAELAGAKRRDGETDKDKAGPGAVSPEDLSSETDDGAG